MDNFKKGGRGFKGGRGGFDREGRSSMHSAVCSTCGKTCQVPFRPTGEKPVYCRDCFAGRSAPGGDRSNRRDIRNESGKFIPTSQQGDSNREVVKALENVNIKLERVINSIENLAKYLKPVASAVVTAPTNSSVSSEVPTKKTKKASKK